MFPLFYCTYRRGRNIIPRKYILIYEQFLRTNFIYKENSCCQVVIKRVWAYQCFSKRLQRVDYQKLFRAYIIFNWHNWALSKLLRLDYMRDRFKLNASKHGMESKRIKSGYDYVFASLINCKLRGDAVTMLLTNKKHMESSRKHLLTQSSV